MNPSIAEALGIRFHHLGLLTDLPAAATTALTLLGYSVAEPVHDPLQGVDLRMAEGDNEFARIEIITPGSSDSALSKMVKRRGDCMYHSCFTVKDVNATLASLAELGLRVITVSAPKPAVLFGGKQVSFHSVEGLGLVEFIEDGS